MGGERIAHHDPAVLEAELLEGRVVVDGHLLQPHSTPETKAGCWVLSPAKSEEEGSGGRGSGAFSLVAGGERGEENAALASGAGCPPNNICARHVGQGVESGQVAVTGRGSTVR
jgi:hypothetical protein